VDANGNEVLHPNGSPIIVERSRFPFKWERNHYQLPASSFTLTQKEMNGNIVADFKTLCDFVDGFAPTIRTNKMNPPLIDANGNVVTIKRFIDTKALLVCSTRVEAEAFAAFCDNEGITHEVIPPYTPQQNGSAERRNRTIMNMVRCMLKSKHLPKELWGEAVSTATYILNRCPTKRLNGTTPEEAWSGSKPNVEHLKVFGSIAYKHVPDQLRKKLDDKSETMILIGYHSTGGYKLYDPVSKVTVISRDVVFDELKE
jgi:hypothetical protein